MSVSILVVDDEPDVADLFRQCFRREARQGNYVLHFAYSGEEALDKLAAGIEPQLIVILSDINMPVMDGLELLREIKRRVWRRRVHHQAGRFQSLEDPASRSVRSRALTNPSAASNGRFQIIPGAHVNVGFGA